MKYTIVFALSLMTAFSTAHAAGPKDVGAFGEFYLGTDSSQVKATKLTPPDEDAKTSGLAVGLRGGSTWSVFMLGVDAQATLGNMNITDESYQDGSWNKTQVYVFGGFDFNVIRLWGAVAVTNESQLTQTVGTITSKTKYFGGTNFKYGGSVKIFKGLHVNGEYYINTPKKAKYDAVTDPVDLDRVYSKWQETGFMITLSWVFDASKAK